MANLRFEHIRTDDGEENLTVHYQGKMYMAHRSHKMWDQIVQGVLINDDPESLKLFELGLALGERLRLSDRITYSNGKLYLDGDPMEDAFTSHVIRMIQAGDDNVQPFVRFMENVAQNPSLNSRKQLGNYVERHGVTLTESGMLVLYKYVYHVFRPMTEGGKPYRSGNQGPAIVNNHESRSGYVYQGLGDIVEMPRSEVKEDPAVGCASGLHVGAWAYVSGSGDVRLEVHVHPRDVVSVPHDANERKIRVCRYTIVREISQDYKELVIPDSIPQPPKEKPKSKEKRASAVVHTPDKSFVQNPTAPCHYRVRVPTQVQWNDMHARARASKKGFRAYATSKGWKWVSGNDNNPSNWRTS